MTISIPLRVRSKIRFRHSTTPGLTACWEWTGYVNDQGAPVTSDEGQTAMCHRYVYEKLRGVVLGKRRLRRICPLNTCVNPNHHVLKGKP